MAVLFLSHASNDDAHASAIECWLKSNGFTDLFVDHSQIRAGDKWAKELKTSAHAARVVVFLVTPNWLASAECFGEFKAAWYMGKRLIPLVLIPNAALIDETQTERRDQMFDEDQGLNIIDCLAVDNTLDLNRDPSVARRLRAGLKAAGANAQVGLDPEAFEIATGPGATPFPGLAAFGDDDADAAVFYGRNREIATTLEELRAMRAMRDKRPLMILGASGAGKSSLLKAGIIPRLRRESPAWLPMRTFRPGADPMLNFAEALARTRADFGETKAYGGIRDDLMKAWQAAEREPESKLLTAAGDAAVIAALESEGIRLRQLANRPGASILIGIDQSEELARAEGDSANALADYLRAALKSEDSDWQLAFTIRTDSFAELQRHRRFQNLETRGYDLRPVPKFRFDNVVEQPAGRFGVEVDPLMIDALMEDAPQEDALPLLAFGMQRLWQPYAPSGKLTEANYHAVGGLKGLIENAAECALRGIDPDRDVPREMRAMFNSQDTLGAATFVPPLVQINDHGATIRRVSKWAEFSAEQQQLLDCFDRWRLVVRKGTHAPDGGTVEVAHEALFREWGRLKDWLEPERARLEALRQLNVAASTWERHARAQSYLTHRDTRLREGLALIKNERFDTRLGETERTYLEHCRTAELGRLGLGIGFLGGVALTILYTVIFARNLVWLNNRLTDEFLRWLRIDELVALVITAGIILAAVIIILLSVSYFTTRLFLRMSFARIVGLLASAGAAALLHYYFVYPHSRF